MIEASIQRIVVMSRWLLAPLLLGLVLALALTVVAFFRKLADLAYGLLAEKVSEVQVTVDLLTLIDYALIGSLMVIVVYSGYENFVEKIRRRPGVDWPAWMTRVSFSGLKQKLFGSLMAIGGITLLKALMKLEVSVSETQVYWLVVANIIFVVAYAVMAFTDHFTHNSDEG